MPVLRDALGLFNPTHVALMTTFPKQQNGFQSILGMLADVNMRTAGQPGAAAIYTGQSQLGRGRKPFRQTYDIILSQKEYSINNILY